MKSLLGLVQSAPCRIDMEFKDADGKPHKHTTTTKTKKEETEEVPVYTNKDSVTGEIRLTPLTTKKLEHQGIKVQLLGQIELASERGVVHEFVSLVRELLPPGDLNSAKVFPFEFKNVELQYDSYRGQQVRCRYLLRVTVTGKGMTPDSKRDFNIWVINYEPTDEAGPPIKMEVGIEDCLHIEFEYDRARYHLRDVVVGRIYFLLVRIKLKHMEMEIRRKETTGAGMAAHSESETLAKYEIMDGAPVRSESVPIRLYLSPYDLAPTYKDVHNKFSVRYFLNLVLVDEEDRRYFKQQEITLFRKAPDTEAEIAALSRAGPPKLASVTYRAPILSPNGSTSGAASSSATAAQQQQQPALVQPQPPTLAPAPVLPAAAAPMALPVSTPLPSASSPVGTAQRPAFAPEPAAAATAPPPPAADGPLGGLSSLPPPPAQGAPAAARAGVAPLQPEAASGDLLGGGGLSSAGAGAAAAADGVAGEADVGLTFADGDNKAQGIL